MANLDTVPGHDAFVADLDLPREIVSIDAEAPVSFAQQRLWLLDWLLPTDSVYNVPKVYRLTGVRLPLPDGQSPAVDPRFVAPPT